MQGLLEFLAKYNNWLLFILLEVVSILLLFRFNSYQGSVYVSTANTAVGTMLSMESAVGQYFFLAETNERLTARNYFLEREVDRLREIAAGRAPHEESLRWSEALAGRTATVGRPYAAEDIDGGEDDRSGASIQADVVMAKVVASTIKDADNLITIDKGSLDGIKRDMGVVSGQGVVGVVYLVGKHYSIVIPVLNTRSRISCSIRGTGYFGYLRWAVGDPTMAYVEDIPLHARFKVGDIIETSGYSSIFPHGVLVGQITEVEPSSDGLSYRLKIRLATDFGNLRDVCVVKDENLQERARLMEAARDSLRGQTR